MRTGKLVKAGSSPARRGSDCIAGPPRALGIAHGYAKATGKAPGASLYGNMGLTIVSMATIHGWCERVLALLHGAAMAPCTPMRGGHFRAVSLLQCGNQAERHLIPQGESRFSLKRLTPEEKRADIEARLAEEPFVGSATDDFIPPPVDGCISISEARALISSFSSERTSRAMVLRKRDRAMKQASPRHGFTLLQIMAITAIMGILRAVATLAYRHYDDRARAADIIVKYDAARTIVDPAREMLNTLSRERQVESGALISENRVSFALPLSRGASAQCAVPFDSVRDAYADPVAVPPQGATPTPKSTVVPTPQVVQIPPLKAPPEATSLPPATTLQPQQSAQSTSTPQTTAPSQSTQVSDTSEPAVA